jgi:AmmeMemoRadiSam system protein B
MVIAAVLLITTIIVPCLTAATKKIRESVIAGSWYPRNPSVLRQQINRFLQNVKVTPKEGKLVALIVPHAGYRYSGQVAAYSYKLLEYQRFDTVVIVAPSHRAVFNGVSVYDQGGYRTPLGIVPLDEELIGMIKKEAPQIRYVPKAHQKEHSLEIQLPFLQVVLPDAKLVPLVMGDQRFVTCDILAGTLYRCIRNIRGKSIVILASTDLSHYHSYEEAKKLDAQVLNRVKKMNAKRLHSDLTQGIVEACGGGPMVATILAAKLLGANNSQILSMANSGDLTGDRSRVVGYMAAAIWSDIKK